MVSHPFQKLYESSNCTVNSNFGRKCQLNFNSDKLSKDKKIYFNCLRPQFE